MVADREVIPIIGLTGAIGAGKTTVAGMLAEMGCVVSDSDVVAREAFEDPEVRARIIGRWGGRILDRAGGIDRQALAEIVFFRPEERRSLESIVHPWIALRRQELFAHAPPGTPALVIDAPLLFEAGVDKECDVTLFVDADRATRLVRLAATRGWDEPELSKREDSQLPLDEKRSRSDYVLSNNGDLAALRSQVRRTLSNILQPRPS